MEIQFDPSLDKLASFIRRVLPSGNGLSEVLRLQVDYKDPGPREHPFCYRFP